MKHIFILLIFLFSSIIHAEGKGLGGKTIELRGSAGLVPYSQFRIKNRDYNFYYTGKRYDVSLSYYNSTNTHGGLYFVNMELENKQNTDTEEEKITILGLGLMMNGSIPIAIRPFAEVGIGYYVAKIDSKTQEAHIEQIYKQGTAIKISLGLGPRIRGVGLYLKVDGEYVSYEKGEDINNTDQKLFNAYQFTYSANVGLQIAL